MDNVGRLMLRVISLASDYTSDQKLLKSWLDRWVSCPRQSKIMIHFYYYYYYYIMLIIPLLYYNYYIMIAVGFWRVHFQGRSHRRW